MKRRLSRPASGKVKPGSSVRGKPQPTHNVVAGAATRPIPGDPPGTSWAVFAKDRAAEKAWRDLCSSMAGPCQRAYDQLCVDPYHEDGVRWIELAGRYAGIRQHELAGGQRLWYRIETGNRIVIVQPHTAHPKATERKRS